ncbi:MAG: hypothetical protein LBJ93_03470 [Clostridiales bacterium]|nr:hypothetical protein [Clostridiales bacterium]
MILNFPCVRFDSFKAKTRNLKLSEIVSFYEQLISDDEFRKEVCKHKEAAVRMKSRLYNDERE